MQWTDRSMDSMEYNMSTVVSSTAPYDRALFSILNIKILKI